MSTSQLLVLNLGRSFNHLRESLQDFGVGVAAIVVCVLFPIPQTDRDRFGAVAGEERDLVLQAVLLQGRDHVPRSEEHTSEIQSRPHLVCRLLLEKKKKEDMSRSFEY